MLSQSPLVHRIDLGGNVGFAGQKSTKTRAAGLTAFGQKTVEFQAAFPQFHGSL